MSKAQAKQEELESQKEVRKTLLAQLFYFWILSVFPYRTTFEEFFALLLNAVCDFQKSVDQPAQRQISKDLKVQEDEQDVGDVPDVVEIELATMGTQTEEVKPPTPEAEEEPPELEARETQVSLYLPLVNEF